MSETTNLPANPYPLPELPLEDYDTLSVRQAAARRQIAEAARVGRQRRAFAAIFAPWVA